MLRLPFTERNTKEKTEALRGSGFVPAVFYGKKTASTPITVSLNAFQRIWKSAGESTVVSIENESEQHDVLIHEVDIHAVTGVPLHIDFYALLKGQKVEVAIPLLYIGESPAVKNLGGVLIKVIHELEVEAEAARLPSEIAVDISALVDFESRITVSDLKLPPGVIAKVDADEVVAIVDEAKEIEEEKPLEEVDMASIEVEKKGKEEAEETVSE